MAYKNTVAAIPMIAFASSGITADYLPLNPLGLTAACFFVKVINTSTEDITISYDGVNDGDYIVSDSTLFLPLQSNSAPNNYLANLAQGTRIYAKGTAGTGNIYVVGYYQPMQ
jgi:hypothetical protein